ncbi:MAG TPA: cupin domain-containing protein [Candidatus Eremiobacteraceae bacterium]|nr:cupin domain-containing protein [Candidatus Eremiobacteraceae bacterium]
MLLASSLIQAREALRKQNEDSVRLFTHGSLDVKYYAPKGVDDQTPHRRDEIYVIAAGSGTFNCAGDKIAFEPGMVLFAAAGVEHRFEEFSDGFETWVFFYGPDGGEGS